MIAGTLFFLMSCGLCLGGAISTVLAKSPIRSAVGLLIAIFGIAGLYLRLAAQFLAAIQLIVYAGAVVILFVFVIMLLGPDAQTAENRARAGRSRLARVAGALVLGFVGLESLGMLGFGSAEATEYPAVRADFGGVEAVGGELFTRAIVPFELATLLLIVAVVGAIAVAKGRDHKKPQGVVDHATRRLFHGPIHPRDVAGSAGTGEVRP